MAGANTYRFSSKESLPAFGLSHYGYRFYDPFYQRWLNQDPIGEEGGINLYRFVENQPTTLLDPFGLSVLKGFAKMCEFGAKGVRRFFGPPLKNIDEAVAAQQENMEIVAKSRKDAREIAKKAGGGKEPIHERDGKTGNMHYHPADRSGGHILYNIAATLTLAHHAQGQNAFIRGAAEVGDFFNPLSAPQDILDIKDAIADIAESCSE